MREKRRYFTARLGLPEVKISSDEARIFRMIHIENLANSFRYGIVSRNYSRYTKYKEIGASKLIW